jgi:hypothetical protein
MKSKGAYCLHKSRQLDHILSQLSPSPHPLPYRFKDDFKNILSSFN